MRQVVATDSSPLTAHGGARRALANNDEAVSAMTAPVQHLSAGSTCSTLVGLATTASSGRPCDREKQVSRGASAVSLRRQHGARRASQRASEVRPRTVGSPVGTQGVQRPHIGIMAYQNQRSTCLTQTGEKYCFIFLSRALNLKEIV